MLEAGSVSSEEESSLWRPTASDGPSDLECEDSGSVITPHGAYISDDSKQLKLPLEKDTKGNDLRPKASPPSVHTRHGRKVKLSSRFMD